MIKFRIISLVSFIFFFFSCRDNKIETLENYSINTYSFLTNIVNIVEATKACKFTHRSPDPLFYPKPVGDRFDLKTLDRDKIISNKKIFIQVFDIWKDKSLLVKNAYEGEVSYYDQIEAVRDVIGVPAFYFLSFGKSRYDWDFEYNEFTEAWVNQFDRANALNFLLVVVIIMSLALVFMGLSRFVKKLRYLVYMYVFFYVISIIVPVYVTSRSGLNLARLTDQIIEIVKSL